MYISNDLHYVQFTTTIIFSFSNHRVMYFTCMKDFKIKLVMKLEMFLLSTTKINLLSVIKLTIISVNFTFFLIQLQGKLEIYSQTRLVLLTE